MKFVPLLKVGEPSHPRWEAVDQTLVVLPPGAGCRWLAHLQVREVRPEVTSLINHPSAAAPWRSPSAPGVRDGRLRRGHCQCGTPRRIFDNTSRRDPVGILEGPGLHLRERHRTRHQGWRPPASGSRGPLPPMTRVLPSTRNYAPARHARLTIPPQPSPSAVTGMAWGWRRHATRPS